MTVEAAQHSVKDREWRALVHMKLNVSLGLVFFWITLPFSVGYHLETGDMPLHDAVGIICEKGATTENQGAGVKYIG